MHGTSSENDELRRENSIFGSDACVFVSFSRRVYIQIQPPFKGQHPRVRVRVQG